MFELVSKMRERSPDRHLVLDCFQESLTEVVNAQHLVGTAVKEGQRRSQVTGPEMTSPKSGGRVGISTQDHVNVRASLQVARIGWNICEVVENARWWSRAVVEDQLGDNLTPCLAGERGNNHSLWILGIDREIRNGGANLIEARSEVRGSPSLKQD